MRNLRLAIFSLLLAPALSMTSFEADAQMVRTVSSEQAQGRGAEPVTIPLARGQGVNISFISMNATIEKAWLDNPSWLTLDSDGCLVSKDSATASTGRQSGSAGRANNSREVTCSAPSYVLHLRRINDLNFVGLPSTPQTTLSVITRNEAGVRQISVFRLVQGNSTFHTVEVTPSVVNNRAGSEFDIALLERGREFAIRQNLLRSGDPLDARILNFINLLASGTVPSNSAMTRSGISLELVNKLTELGRGVTTTPTLQPPRKDTSVTPSHKE
jgi:hypothetical protein